MNKEKKLAFLDLLLTLLIFSDMLYVMEISSFC